MSTGMYKMADRDNKYNCKFIKIISVLHVLQLLTIKMNNLML